MTFKVKWVGLRNCTWETFENVKHLQSLKDYLKKKKLTTVVAANCGATERREGSDVVDDDDNDEEEEEDDDDDDDDDDSVDLNVGDDGKFTVSGK
jgi:phosphopantothenoylcysteine synthetase/decarboxylase